MPVGTGPEFSANAILVVPQSVPEPSSLVLLGLGALLFFARLNR